MAAVVVCMNPVKTYRHTNTHPTQLQVFEPKHSTLSFPATNITSSPTYNNIDIQLKRQLLFFKHCNRDQNELVFPFEIHANEVKKH
jgi:hypothetical protein